MVVGRSWKTTICLLYTSNCYNPFMQRLKQYQLDPDFMDRCHRAGGGDGDRGFLLRRGDGYHPVLQPFAQGCLDCGFIPYFSQVLLSPLILSPKGFSGRMDGFQPDWAAVGGPEDGDQSADLFVHFPDDRAVLAGADRCVPVYRGAAGNPGEESLSRGRD